MGDRKGSWQQTFTGRQFWPCDPRPEDVCLEDIAHHLALMCRFGGACRVFYSVAEHSVRVAELVWDRTNGDREAALAGLLHDASEAYLVDIPKTTQIRFLRWWIFGVMDCPNYYLALAQTKRLPYRRVFRTRLSK
jgi:hypothetical protein